MTLRARTGSPPCSAASVTSAAGVSGATPVGLLLGGDRLAQPGDRDRERLIQRQQQALGEAAGGPRGRRRRPALSALERCPGRG